MKTDRNMYYSIRFILLLLAPCLTVAAGQSDDPWTDSLSSLIRTARTNNLPVEPLENKIREGRAKGRSAREIYTVLRKRSTVLSKIAGEHGGTIPAGYSYKRELYTRERILLQQPSRPTSPASAENRQQKKTYGHAKTKPDNVATTPQDNTEENTTDTDNTKLRKQMEKRIQKAEKINEKAFKRAQKRMDKAQKRMQKRLSRQRGQK